MAAAVEETTLTVLLLSRGDLAVVVATAQAAPHRPIKGQREARAQAQLRAWAAAALVLLVAVVLVRLPGGMVLPQRLLARL
jgi:hypothetical protein